MYKFLLSLFLLLSTLSATARKVVRVACVGNSITYGTGIANREHDAYPAQLQRMLGKDYVVGQLRQTWCHSPATRTSPLFPTDGVSRCDAV